MKSKARSNTVKHKKKSNPKKPKKHAKNKNNKTNKNNDNSKDRLNEIEEEMCERFTECKESHDENNTETSNEPSEQSVYEQKPNSHTKRLIIKKHKLRYRPIQRVKGSVLEEASTNANQNEFIETMSESNSESQSHSESQSNFDRQPNISECTNSTEQCYIVKSGDSLMQFIQDKGVEKFVPRLYCRSITQYCVSNGRMLNGKVGVLSGLKNTGKTTMMLHTIVGMTLDKSNIPIDDIAYICIIREGLDMETLCHVVNSIGVKYVFVDNITLIEDFSARSYLLVEKLDKIKRIVIAGDCVFALNTAINNSLYGKALKWETHMSFKEYNKIFDVEISKLHSKNVFGRFMSKDSLISWVHCDGVENPYQYIKEVILKDTLKEMRKNQDSLTRWGRGLINISEYRLVYIAFMTILRVGRVVNYNHFMSSSKEMRRQVDRAMEKYAPISERETLVSIEQNIEAYCYEMLDLMINIGVISPVHNIVETNERAGLYRETDIEYVCNIPSLLYKIAEASMVESAFDMSDGMLGVLNENLIASQCCIWTRRKTNTNVFYARYSVTDAAQRVYGDTNKMPEVDIVVQYTDTTDLGKLVKKHILIEVKTSNHVNGAHTKNMNANSIKDVIHNIDKKYCVYGGDTRFHCDVQYINTNDFLKNIDRWLKFSD